MSVSLITVALVAVATPDFQAALDRLQTDQQVPGVSAVVGRGDQVLFAGASGLADIESARPATPDTVFYAGSLSKIFTAVLTLQLVEQKQLSLDYTDLKTFRDDRAISVHHLLTHSSGLQREGDFGYWFSADFPDASALTAYLSTADLRSSPGENLHYSNIGYAALGLVIERATGEPYRKLLRSNVLEPLGMRASGAPGPVAGVATGYSPVGRIIPSEQRPFAGVGRQVGNRHVREYHDARAMSPAFGVYTSANDLSRLARFLLSSGEHEVLSAGMREKMRTRQASGWGLGLKIGTLDGRRVARHEGWFAAHRSHLLLDVDSGISVVVLTNSDGASPADIAEILFNAALHGASPSK